MLEDLLPKEYDYVIKNCIIISDQRFYCEIRSNIKNEEDFKKWLRGFQIATDTKWILRSSASRNERSKFLLSKDYVCKFSSYRKKENGKRNKNCLASLSIRIKLSTKSTCYKDPLVKKGLCAYLKISFQHSHNVVLAETLMWPSSEDKSSDLIDSGSDQMSDTSTAAPSSEEICENQQIENCSEEICENSLKEICENQQCENSFKAICKNQHSENSSQEVNQEPLKKHIQDKIIGDFLEQMTRIASMVQGNNNNDLFTRLKHFSKKVSNIESVKDLSNFLQPLEDYTETIK